MQVHDESLFLRAWGNLMRLAVALLLSGGILAYFAFVYFTAEVLQEGRCGWHFESPVGSFSTAVSRRGLKVA